MKKIFALLLTCLLCLSVVGCSEKPYQAAWDGFCYTATEHQAVEMKSEDRKYIINLLNEAVWETNIEDCECDFYFSLQRQRVEYHSECGTFNDITNGKSTKVAEDQRLKINTILNLDAAKEKVGTVTDFSKFSNMPRETSKIEVTFDNSEKNGGGQSIWSKTGYRLRLCLYVGLFNQNTTPFAHIRMAVGLDYYDCGDEDI